MGLIKPIGGLERGMSKENLCALAEADAQMVIDSDQYDLLKVYVEMKRYELYFKTAMEKIREAATLKAQETGMKSFNYDDARVSNMQRTVYKFDADPTWRRLQGDMEIRKDKLKHHEELLKNLEGETGSYVDEETGELIQLVAPEFEVIETIMVKL